MRVNIDTTDIRPCLYPVLRRDLDFHVMNAFIGSKLDHDLNRQVQELSNQIAIGFRNRDATLPEFAWFLEKFCKNLGIGSKYAKDI